MQALSGALRPFVMFAAITGRREIKSPPEQPGKVEHVAESYRGGDLLDRFGGRTQAVGGGFQAQPLKKSPRRGAELLPELPPEVHQRATGVQSMSLEVGSMCGLPGPRLRLRLARPFCGAAPGQAAVLYDGGRVIGCGTIGTRERV